MSDEWGMAFCMSQSGNPVCHPEPWRLKSPAYWKQFEKGCDRGDYVQAYSDHCTYTVMKDSSILRLVDDDEMATEELRIIVEQRERAVGWIQKDYGPMSAHFYKSFYGTVCAGGGN